MTSDNRPSPNPARLKLSGVLESASGFRLERLSPPRFWSSARSSGRATCGRRRTAAGTTWTWLEQGMWWRLQGVGNFRHKVDTGATVTRQNIVEMRPGHTCTLGDLGNTQPLFFDDSGEIADEALTKLSNFFLADC